MSLLPCLHRYEILLELKSLRKGPRLEKEQAWEVYIIQSEAGHLYTGITTNLERRFADHQSQKKGARFFRISSPKCILFKEIQKNRSEASKRECEIKKMKREEKLKLISSCQSL
jgi:putative endonuclease